jgi:hypothetical protein
MIEPHENSGKPFGSEAVDLGRQHEQMPLDLLRDCLAETAVGAMAKYSTGTFEVGKGYVDRDVAAFLLDCFSRLDKLDGSRAASFDNTKKTYAFVPLQDYKQRTLDTLFNRAADTIILRGITDSE